MENNKLFVYGILKRGYELDLRQKWAKFLGEAFIEGATLYGIGPVSRSVLKTSEWDTSREFNGVGLRLNETGNIAHGELWEVPSHLWEWLDQIEQNGHVYTRKIVETQTIDKTGDGITPVDAWVYEHSYPDFVYKYPIKNGRF